MSEAVKANGFPLMTALGDLNLMAVDATGSMKRIASGIVPPVLNAASLGLEDLIATAGLRFYVTNDSTEGLPEDSNTLYGIIMSYTFSAGRNAMLLFFTFGHPVRIYSQQKFSEWHGWQRLV